jgi:hypothetical protein
LIGFDRAGREKSFSLGPSSEIENRGEEREIEGEAGPGLIGSNSTPEGRTERRKEERRGKEMKGS